MKFDGFTLFPWGMISRSGDRATKLLESIKDCGFNASCFVPETEFETCRKLGLKIYASLEKSTNQERNLAHEKMLFDSASTKEGLRSFMQQLLKDIPEDVTSIYVTDEPGATVFPKIKTLVDCIHEITPWAEAYVNLFPNYAVCGAPNLSQLEAETYEEYLERFAEEVNPDSISLDNYKVNISHNFQIEKDRIDYFNNMLQARAACDKYNLPFQFIACCNQLRNDKALPTLGNLAVQAYTALAAGAKVISWFLFWARGYYLYAPIDDTTGKDIVTPTWYLLREVNRRILPLGELLFPMEYKGMYFTNSEDYKNALPVTVCSPIKHFSSDEDCMLGHYVDTDGKDIILVVNCNPLHPAKIDIDLGNDIKYYNTEYHDWFPPMLTNKRGQSSPIWLEPGCGILIK